MKYPSNLLFFFILMFSSLIAISANSLPAMWIGLEINLMSFIPLMSNSSNSLSTESSIHYFLIQALASSLFLFSSILSTLLSFDLFMNFLLPLSLLLKLGAAPFHYWLPKVMEGLSWINTFILLSWQKLAPLIILSYVISNSLMFILTSIMSVIMGSLGGLNQTSLRKIMAFSSINHIGWMILSLLLSTPLWLCYFIFYSILNLAIILPLRSKNLNHISQISPSPNLQSTFFKITFTLNFLSLGGLPPFLGFVPKWLVIENFCFYTSLIPAILLTVILSLITLFFYIRISLSIFLFSSSSSSSSQSLSLSHTLLSLISILGLPLIILSFYL